MDTDLITKQAIILRDIITELEENLQQKNYTPTLADKHLLQLLDKACKSCVLLGGYFINQTYADNINSAPPFVFQKLVEAHIIDASLSKRLLSLIAFRKLIIQAALLKGKHIHLKLTSGHLKDFHTFTQNVMLA